MLLGEAVGVSNQAVDQHHFLPKVERIVANAGQLPEKLIADAGYCSTSNIEASEQRGLDAYLSTSRQEHGKRPRPSRGPAPRDLDARGRMDRKLRSNAGLAIYALRKIIVEPVFGQIKGARGLDRFLLRGAGESRQGMDPDSHYQQHRQAAPGFPGSKLRKRAQRG